MAIMLDADVIIRGEKGTFDLKTWFEEQANETFEIAAITVAELWHGVERARPPHKHKRLRYLEGILSALPVVTYTEQTAYLHARIWARLASAGKTIGAYDLIVGATAIEKGSHVATFNKRHFDLIPGLKTLTPVLC
jgi:tRNA(fMet)-specific endonuclease VapC